MSSDPSPASRASHPTSPEHAEKSDDTPVDPEKPVTDFDTSPAVRYLTMRCGDRKLAEDIAQDALVTILTHEQLRGDWRSLHLLFRVALHEFSNHQRKEVARSAHMSVVPAAELSLLPENRSFDIDLAIDVRDALGRLDRDDRRLILLYWEGYSYAEMAAANDITVAAIRMRLKRARERFVEELAEYQNRRR